MPDAQEAQAERWPAAAAQPGADGVARHAAAERQDGPLEASWTSREIEALLRVSNAAALSAHVSDVLHVVAEEARQVTRAKATSILLTAPGGGFRLVASNGMSRQYRRFLESGFVSYGRSPSRTVADRLTPVVIDDLMRDPRVNRAEAREWRRAAQRERYRALMAVPLMVGRRCSGVLNLYRAQAGPWLGAEIELAATFAQHAASAIDGARLIDSQRRQLGALEHLVRVLRDQTHEYANRLHALSGLLALGETRDAQGFLAQLMTLHHENYASVIERVYNPVIAGLLLAQMSVARQRGVEVRLDRRTRLERLPPTLGGAEAVTIVANLIENAVEAVAGLPAHRRRVTVRITQRQKSISIAVRDWGCGLGSADEEVLLRGRSATTDNSDISLALVSEAATSAQGSIEIRRLATGTAFLVKLPYQ